MGIPLRPSGDVGGSVDGGSASSWWIIVTTVTVIAYYCLLEGRPRGQTVGKMFLRIQVRDAALGGPIGHRRAFLRRLVGETLLLLRFPWIIDLLFPLWDKRRQTLHDKAAGSIVVRVV